MSTNSNGAVNRSTFINTGVALISIIGILYVAYVANGLDEKFSNFVKMWESRIKVSNAINNLTQDRLLGMAANQTLITDTQTEAILQNLSDHRLITNNTRDTTLNLSRAIEDQNQLIIKLIEDQTAILNATKAITSDEYNEAAEKKVENILGNMTEEHEIIFKALNITKTETNDEEKQLELLLKDFVEGHKDKLENKTNTS